MDIFVKSAAGVLIAVVLSLILSKYGKDFSALLAISVCAMVAVGAFSYLRDIISFVWSLQERCNLDGAMLTILFKAVGIGMLSEITAMVCADSGNSAFGKVIQFLSTAVILYLCIPLFMELMEIVEGVLGTL